MSLNDSRRSVLGRLPENSARLGPGHHYLTEFKCGICGWTLTVDNTGPSLFYKAWKCEGDCKRKGFTSFLQRTNDGN